MKNTGGNAFPLPCTSDIAGGVHWAEDGMTLRDYFAAKALAGCCADPSYLPKSADVLAEVCYEIADAMLKARES